MSPSHELPPVKVGDRIYVETWAYLSHGRDDVIGGLATVIRVDREQPSGEERVFVEVAEHPGCSYNWEYLSARQEELKQRFGDQVAHPDPDWRAEFNEW
jgi:hypothetical protein